MIGHSSYAAFADGGPRHRNPAYAPDVPEVECRNCGEVHGADDIIEAGLFYVLEDGPEVDVCPECRCRECGEGMKTTLQGDESRGDPPAVAYCPGCGGQP